MFEDSLLEAHPKLRSHQRISTVASFAIQGLILLALAVLPMLMTQALPTQQLISTLVAPPPPPPPPPPPASKAASMKPQRSPVVKSDQLQQPIKIPEKIAMIRDEPPATEQGPPSVSAGVVGGVPGGVAGGQVGGVLGGVLGSVPSAVPKIEVPQRIRVSQGVSQGLLIHKVMPVYPEAARTARIQGVVVLHAQISKDGKIEHLQVVSGPAMLQPAAIHAVRQWRYKPYVLNGQPVEVDTVISVNFKLSGAEA